MQSLEVPVGTFGDLPACSEVQFWGHLASEEVQLPGCAALDDPSPQSSGLGPLFVIRSPVLRVPELCGVSSFPGLALGTGLVPH